MTPNDLHAMTPEDRTATFDRLAADLYGNHSYGNKAAHDFGVSRATIHNWKSGNIVPFAVILLLETWIRDRALTQLGAQIDHLRELLPR